jgi:hypothetical protein
MNKVLRNFLSLERYNKDNPHNIDRENSLDKAIF